ncbi:hypothetical protein KC19_7G079800 [Ceratodon purpureus]|uniref:MLO-like protein n=1 Tax=Ceratodon purpureus TaxID=3225 RepID=A0A8T0H8W2_CERPU|nr:hypothetical protein KC19_7G079800 [Ceratodon purpureus]
MSGVAEQKSLEQTPTWAVAAVCTVFVVASLIVERLLKYLGSYLRRSKQKPLLHTLEQIKDELMLLGFISLSLTVFQAKIASMCMPERLNKFMLPCRYHSQEALAEAPVAAAHRRLLSSGGTVTCPAGKVQVISTEGLHQLHIFIFVMAIVHVIYSAITVLVGLWQVHRWKKWEIESQTKIVKCYNKALAGKHPVGEFLNGRMKYKFLRTSRTGYNLDSYVYSFFRQFGKPIYKSDYLCLRLGFIQHHDLKSEFDFHSYIKRSMETDFQHVVGISGYLWAFVCIYLLVDINGWYTYFWLAFVPVVMILIVGAKLQLIITSLAYEVRNEAKGDEKHIPVCKVREEMKNVPAIRPSDKLFWFSNPRVFLFLIHFILFQNAFELAFFFWTMTTYGYSSCLVGSTWMVIVRIVVGFSVQILCSASTLPLYALVTQLGSGLKITVFRSESTGAAVKGWARAAKKKHRAPDHVHEPLSPHERIHGIGIIGINKALDENGHPVDIPLGTKVHNGHVEVHHHKNGHPHDQHPHVQHPHGQHADHAHSRTQDESHTVEISEQPSAAANESIMKADEDDKV